MPGVYFRGSPAGSHQDLREGPHARPTRGQGEGLGSHHRWRAAGKRWSRSAQGTRSQTERQQLAHPDCLWLAGLAGESHSVVS